MTDLSLTVMAQVSKYLQRLRNFYGDARVKMYIQLYNNVPILRSLISHIVAI